jgi:hypothetical protein
MKFERTFILFIISYVQSILFHYSLPVILLDISYLYSAFIFWLTVSFLIIYDSKLEDFLSYLSNRKQERERAKSERNNCHKSFDNVPKPAVSIVIPNWTPEIIQSLDSKTFMALLAEHFKLTGFVVKYPTSTDKDMVDVFFLYTPENVRFAIVKCRAVGGDLVRLETVSSFSDLSKQYGVINLALATTGYFEDDPSGLIKNKRGFNLIGTPQLISMLTALPINKQAYLFTNMMLNKN